MWSLRLPDPPDPSKPLHDTVKGIQTIFVTGLLLIAVLWLTIHVFTSFDPFSTACNVMPFVALVVGFASVRLCVGYVLLVTAWFAWFNQLLFEELGYVESWSKDMLMLSLATCTFGGLIRSLLVNGFSDRIFRRVLIFFTLACSVTGLVTLVRAGISVSGVSAALHAAPWIMLPVVVYRKEEGGLEHLMASILVACIPALVSFGFAIKQRYLGLSAFEELYWVGQFGLNYIGFNIDRPEAPGLTASAASLSRFASIIGGFGLAGCVMFRKQRGFLFVLSVLVVLGSLVGIIGTGRRFGYAFVLLFPIAYVVVRRRSLTLLSYGALFVMLAMVILNSDGVIAWIGDAQRGLVGTLEGTTVAKGSERDALYSVATFNTRIQTFALLKESSTYTWFGIPENMRTDIQDYTHGLPVQILVASGIVGLIAFVLLTFFSLFQIHRIMLRFRPWVRAEKVGFIAGVVTLLQAAFFVAGLKSGTGPIVMIPLMLQVGILVNAWRLRQEAVVGARVPAPRRVAPTQAVGRPAHA